MASLSMAAAASSYFGIAVGANQKPPTGIARSPAPCKAVRAANAHGDQGHTDGAPMVPVPRRDVLNAALIAAAAPCLSLALPRDASALIPTNAVAGRVPGLSEPDENGWRTYKRPANKSGGHGVGWSELIPYSFKVPEGWEEVPVSIADLGGTEIDLRFNSSAQGKLAVVVAPVLRFSSTLGNNAKIEKIGTPEKVINAFGPEVTGQSVEGRVLDTGVVERNDLKYYQYELDPHILVSTTAQGNRLYILTLSASGRQWKKHESDLRAILDSFRVG